MIEINESDKIALKKYSLEFMKQDIHGTGYVYPSQNIESVLAEAQKIYEFLVSDK
jgi:hypothetical protein